MILLILLMLACAGVSSPAVEPAGPAEQAQLQQPEQPFEPAPVVNIQLSSPTPGQVISGGTVHVAGTARVFEGHVQVRALRGEQVLLEHTVVTEGGPESHAFETDLVLDPGPVRLQVFSTSPKDGSPQDLVQVELVLE